MTIVTNFMIYYGALSVIALAVVLVNNNIPFQYFAPPYLVGILLLILSLYFQAKKKTHEARLCAVFLLNFMGWQAAFIYGTTFNGYLIFFPAIVYSVIAFSKASSRIKWTALSVSLLGLPMIDILSHNQMIPLTGLDSRHFSVSLLLLDTLVITFFLATITSIEKMFYDRYEEQLENLNSHLEEKVHERTHLLLDAKEKVIQSEIVKTQFISNISHELRTPLQGLLGALSLVQKRFKKIEGKGGPLVAELQKIHSTVKLASRAADRLERLVLPILEIAKLNQGNQLRPTEFDFQETVELVLLKMRFEIQNKGLLIDTQSRSGRVVVNTDQALVSLIIEQLVANAVRYALPQTRISIDLFREHDTVSASISNQGVGIEAQELELIFQPFFQGSRTDQKIGGKGLGLFLSRKYARELGGDVTIISSDPHCTIFNFSVPAEMKQSSFENNVPQRIT